jgi:hypothetical protein
MRDLKDLDAAWSLLEQRADDHSPADLTARPLPKQRAHRWSHRGWLVAAAASAAVVATAVAVPATVLRHDGGVAQASADRSIAPGGASANLDWSALPKDHHYLFVFDGMPGTHIRSVIGVGTDLSALPNDDTYQEVQTEGPYGGLVFKVNAPGSWAPPTDATQTTVAGLPAYYGLFLLHPELPGHPVRPRVALAWQYVPGSWVTVAYMSQQPIPQDLAAEVAGLVRIGDGGPIPDPAPGWR